MGIKIKFKSRKDDGEEFIPTRPLPPPSGIFPISPESPPPVVPRPVRPAIGGKVFVSCIVASDSGWKRPLQEVVHEFQSMTYPEMELVIVDDDPKGCDGAFGGDHRVHYLKLPRPMGLDEKLTIGTEFAAGEFLLRLDDGVPHSRNYIERALKKGPLHKKLTSDAARDTIEGDGGGETQLP
jgi:hypothetical protein